MTTNRIQVAVLAVVLVLQAPVMARAEDRIMMHADNIEPDHDFIERLIKEVGEECHCEVGPWSFHIGRFDLNDDGVEELFVYYSLTPYCGTAGCDTEIFRKLGGQWEKIGQITTIFGDLMGPFYLIADDERIDGWRTLLTYEYGLQWDAARSRYYDLFCLTESCFELYRPCGLEDKVRRK